MAESDVVSSPKKRKTPWWVKALWFALSLTAILSIFLGSTGYPAEEWPFVAGVFGVVMFLSTLAVSVVLLLAAKGLSSYRRRTLSAIGLDVEAEDTKVAALYGLRAAVTMVIALLYVSAAWGLALNVSLAILNSLGMPAFASGAYVAAVVMASAGAGGLFMLIGLSFVGYFCMRRSGTKSVPMPWVLRLSLNVVQGVEKRATFGAGSGSSVGAGAS